MRNRLVLVGLLAYVLGAGAVGSAEPVAGPAPPAPPSAPMAPHHHPDMSPSATQAEIVSPDGKATIPFRLVNNHVVFPLTIQGTRLDMILDTGMPMEGLLLYRTPRLAPVKLDLAEGVKARIGGAGATGAPIEADMAQGLAVEAGDLRLRNVSALVAPPMAAFSSYHDGVIGAALFNRFVVALDYDAGRITLSNPATWEPPAGAVSVPLTFVHNNPYAEIAVVTADGRRLSSSVVVDLGAAHPISLNLGSIDGLEAPAGTVHAIIGRGVAGTVKGQVGRLAALEIGGLRLDQIVATFPDPESQHPGGMDEHGGNLGDGVLQRFNVAFDYSRKRMTLVPNRRFREPFEWDMSGLSLQADDKGGVVIEAVIDRSPAGEAGLRAGDVVTRVNGKDLAVADLFALRDRLRKAGEAVELTVRRDGKPLTAAFRTARLV
jgi:hypothetical protein